MDFKTFFEKKIMMSFFVSVTCICAAMALVGMTFETDTRFGYEAFLSPLIFGLLASIPTLVTYSKRNCPSNRQRYGICFTSYCLKRSYFRSSISGEC